MKHKKPKAFLLENVKGLVNINEGKTLKEIIFDKELISLQTHLNVNCFILYSFL